MSTAGRCVQPSEAGGERELRVLSKKMYDLISRMTMSVAVHEVVISGEMLEFTLFCTKKKAGETTMITILRSHQMTVLEG